MTQHNAKTQRGFTLLELLIVVGLTVILIGSIYLQLQTAQLRSANEQKQLDLFQEAREYMDQLSRDLRQVGYPNPRNTDTTVDPSTLALGLTNIDQSDLGFEGGVDNNGTTLATQYSYNANTTGNCPCLERSQQSKGASAAGQVEVQNVQNYTNGNNIPIFQYFANGGTTPVTGSYTYGNNGGADEQTLATIDTVRIQLVVQSPYVDLQTGVKPTITLISTVRINNCSQATTGQLSCSN